MAGSNEEATMKTWMRVKSLVNDGEFSKAARDMNEVGVADITERVVAELKSKYPKRVEEVKLPDKEEIICRLQEAKTLDDLTRAALSITATQPMRGSLQRTDPGLSEHVEIDDELEEDPETWAKRIFSKFGGRTCVNADDIETAVKKIKKSAGGGPQQITPWMLKQAIESSENRACQLVIAKLSNRMSKGDFGTVSGRAFSMMRSVALWKTNSKTSVRPIGIGGALKRVFVKAHCNLVKSLLHELVDKYQLEVMKGGYETGVHVMRALAQRCTKDGHVILLIDFNNAFNACSRSLLMKLAATFLPEIAPLAYWLYAEETELFV